MHCARWLLFKRHKTTSHWCVNCSSHKTWWHTVELKSEFLLSGLDRGEWSESRSSCLTPWGRDPSIRCTVGCVWTCRSTSSQSNIPGRSHSTEQSQLIFSSVPVISPAHRVAWQRAKIQLRLPWRRKLRLEYRMYQNDWSGLEVDCIHKYGEETYKY
jgi:hypothetical protein